MHCVLAESEALASPVFVPCFAVANVNCCRACTPTWVTLHALECILEISILEEHGTLNPRLYFATFETFQGQQHSQCTSNVGIP